MGLCGLVRFEGMRLWLAIEDVILAVQGSQWHKLLSNPLWSPGMESTLKAVLRRLCDCYHFEGYEQYKN